VNVMQPHQQRVVDELVDLQKKTKALDAFIGGDVYCSLSVEERGRLRVQFHFMAGYADVLAQRIAAFGSK
jgi:hypothetical protein